MTRVTETLHISRDEIQGEKRLLMWLFPLVNPLKSGGIVIWEIIVAETQLSDRSSHL